VGRTDAACHNARRASRAKYVGQVGGIDLRQLRYFIAVAEERNFTRAAERLYMSQSALSRSIRALEETVGTPLLTRGYRDIELTPAGRILLDEALGIHDQAVAAVHRARMAADDSARLRVSARGCDAGLLGELVGSYNAVGPDVPAEAILVDWRVQAEEVRQGDAEVTLMRRPFDARGLDSDLLRLEPRVALLAIDHPFAEREEVDLAELVGEPITVWPGTADHAQEHWAGADGAVGHTWIPGPKVTDPLQFLATVRFGQAIGFVPESSILNVPFLDLRSVRVNGLTPSELHIVWSETTTSPAVAQFVRHAVEAQAQLVTTPGPQPAPRS
jgi:DNA-binding transcriptional LysR family regulator